MDPYMEGLADDILDELPCVDQPNTLQELIALCLRTAGCLESRCLVWGGSRPSQPLLAPAGTGGEDFEPMQLGAARPRLTPMKKHDTVHRISACTVGEQDTLPLAALSSLRSPGSVLQPPAKDLPHV